MTWVLGVKTADVAGAGTDADTWVIILGDQGQSPEPGYVWVLDNSGDDMEQGDYDLYYIDVGPIGTPHTIQLWFDPIGHPDSPNWICDYMRLYAPGREFLFQVNREFTEQGWYDIKRTGHKR